MSLPQLFSGGTFRDDRGLLAFVNDFTFDDVKRFYQINNADSKTVRAWQGHKIEHKYFYAASGSFVIAWVKIDDWENPAADLIAEHRMLSVQNPAVLSIPPGYANGIKALEENSSLLIFSNMTIEDSTLDRWSFDSNQWFNWKEC